MVDFLIADCRTCTPSAKGLGTLSGASSPTSTTRARRQRSGGTSIHKWLFKCYSLFWDSLLSLFSSSPANNFFVTNCTYNWRKKSISWVRKLFNYEKNLFKNKKQTPLMIGKFTLLRKLKYSKTGRATLTFWIVYRDRAKQLLFVLLALVAESSNIR